jgi:hypothetical protein
MRDGVVWGRGHSAAALLVGHGWQTLPEGKCVLRVKADTEAGGDCGGCLPRDSHYGIWVQTCQHRLYPPTDYMRYMGLLHYCASRVRARHVCGGGGVGGGADARVLHTPTHTGTPKLHDCPTQRHCWAPAIRLASQGQGQPIKPHALLLTYAVFMAMWPRLSAVSSQRST